MSECDVLHTTGLLERRASVVWAERPPGPAALVLARQLAPARMRTGASFNPCHEVA